jgi:hypothetical protein
MAPRTSAARHKAPVQPAPAAKRKAPTEAPARSRQPKTAAGQAGIKVRMYRQGLGDCFLISLLQDDGNTFRLMIDCGVILGTRDSTANLQAVVQDIIATTDAGNKGGFVDVLAVTHEHYDHVAGFVLAKDLFADGGVQTPGKLAVGEVWFAWTEDPQDDVANHIRESRARRLAALSALAGRMNGMNAAPPTELSDALRFFGVSAGGAGIGATAQAMQNATAFAYQDQVRYHRPGAILTPDGAPQLRIFVLGPPRDEATLKKTDSTTEVYHFGVGDLEETVLRAAANGAPDPSLDPYAPFEGAYTHRLSELAAGSDGGPLSEFLAQRYFSPAAPTPENDRDWRRIDGDWLMGAEQLALALDSATNNTSLVLAIELVDSGKVLLFPADAQVGNWLSWQMLRFGEGPDAMTGPDLLRRTVFYKVGHHGSHNATLKEKGLEAMVSPDLVAFIPVDHEMAVKKGWGQMPLPALIDALKQRCGERVVRIDEDLPIGFAAVVKGPDGGPRGALWYEWTMPR